MNKRQFVDDSNTTSSSVNADAKDSSLVKDESGSEDSKTNANVTRDSTGNNKLRTWVNKNEENEPREAKRPKRQETVRARSLYGVELNGTQKEDEFDIFGKYVANELRNFHGEPYERILAEVKHVINNGLYEAHQKKNEINDNNWND